MKNVSLRASVFPSEIFGHSSLPLSDPAPQNRVSVSKHFTAGRAPAAEISSSGAGPSPAEWAMGGRRTFLLVWVLRSGEEGCEAWRVGTGCFVRRAAGRASTQPCRGAVSPSALPPGVLAPGEAHLTRVAAFSPFLPWNRWEVTCRVCGMSLPLQCTWIKL